MYIVFATLVMEGGLGADDCPNFAPDNKKKLQEYLGRFRFDW